MSQKRSKRKRSSREDWPIKEQLKIEEGVFDNRTILRLSKLFAKGLIARLVFVVSTGKEADVYYAEGGEAVKNKPIAVKIFRMETSNFQRRMEYMIGDPRFGRIKRNIYAIVNEWCKKEFGNLKVAEIAKVHAPHAYAFFGNVLVIEFIGEAENPANQLKNVKLDEPEKVLDIILEDIRKLYRNDLVHGDVSEYNILMKDSMPYMIDFGQAVVLKHPNAIDFLKRDISNILNYFHRIYNLERDEDKTFEWVTKG